MGIGMRFLYPSLKIAVLLGIAALVVLRHRIVTGRTQPCVRWHKPVFGVLCLVGVLTFFR